jgi:L-lysine 6-oxidase
MAKAYRIHPAIGVARVGNSPTEFYLAPETIGGLPIACDADGEPISDGGAPRHVIEFKDKDGRIKRQAARFRVFEYDSDKPGAPGREVKPGKNGVAAVEWTVHIANKKAAWWNFSEQAGDLGWGEWNSYENQAKNPDLINTPWAVALRNASVKDPKKRQKLIIDPGPRTVSKKAPRAVFDAKTGYSHVSFPPTNLTPEDIRTLGELIVDHQGRLLVLGGHGHAGGPAFNLTSFAGADGWYDDVSDGPVYASVKMADGRAVDAEMGWVIVGSPKFAPELVNIVTLDDLIYDIAIREMGFNKKIYNKGWNHKYRPNFDRDIKPILDRPAGYRWVSTIPFMSSFSPAPFDARDASPANKANRQAYLSYFRTPVPPRRFANQKEAAKALAVANGPASGFGDGATIPKDVPLMPVNSGSNPLNPVLIIKFLTITPTQYFFLEQWADGIFDVAPDPGPAERSVTAEDHVAPGNCVGGPLCPGIETTWIMQNKEIYTTPYRIKPAHPESYYAKHGLSPSEDEGRGGGCEPGDLTKRMAIPWQADFFDCSTQYVNFTNPSVNKDSSGTPVPPTFYVYWWPPQSPEFTMVDAMDANTQLIDGVSVGQLAPYARGINSFGQMILAWSYLPFVGNRNRTHPHYPYFVEQERNTDQFAVGVVGLGDVNVMGGNYSVNPAGNYVPFWYLLKDVYDLK